MYGARISLSETATHLKKHQLFFKTNKNLVQAEIKNLLWGP